MRPIHDHTDPDLTPFQKALRQMIEQEGRASAGNPTRQSDLLNEAMLFGAVAITLMVGTNNTMRETLLDAAVDHLETLSHKFYAMECAAKGIMPAEEHDTAKGPPFLEQIIPICITEAEACADDDHGQYDVIYSLLAALGTAISFWTKTDPARRAHLYDTARNRLDAIEAHDAAPPAPTVN